MGTYFLQYAVPVCAVAGFALGVLNLVLAWKSHRVSVILLFSGDASRDSGTVVLRVVNKSYFPITVKEGGLLINGSRYQCFYGPRRIESRDAFEFCDNIATYSEDPSGQPYTKITDIQDAKGVYAILADGTVFRSQNGVTQCIASLAAKLQKAA